MDNIEYILILFCIKLFMANNIIQVDAENRFQYAEEARALNRL
jgi:hypothetical protein